MIYVKTIGTAAGRDFSTTAAWNASLDSAPYVSGDMAVGEMYKDSDFTVGLPFDNGETIGLRAATCRAGPNQGHTGIAGTGVRWLAVSAITVIDVNSNPNYVRTVSHLEVNDGAQAPGSGAVVRVQTGTGGGTVNLNTLIIHNSTKSAGDLSGIITAGTLTGVININNCIVYNISVTGAVDRIVRAIRVGNTVPTTTVQNCTSDNIVNDTPTGGGTGISAPSSANMTVQNCVATRTSGLSLGVVVDFSLGAAVIENNLASEDLTATGTGSITGLVPADTFVALDTDYHLKAGSLCIGAGSALGISPQNVGVDIDQFDRTLGATIWDIGADQFGESGPFTDDMFHVS